MNKGKLEGAIIVPAGGWSLDVTDGTGTETVTIPGDGHYYISSVGDLSDGLLQELEDQLNATMVDAFSVSISALGVVTIENLAANATSITWTSTDLRDVLGYSGNVAGQAIHTATLQARALWLPSCPVTKRNSGNWAGDHETDRLVSEAPNGSVYAIKTARRTVLALTWDAISQAKTWTDNESLANESFERFLLDCIYGEAAFSDPSGLVRYYPDETDDGTFNTYRVGAGLEDFKPEQWTANYAVLWRIHIPRLVKLPE